MLEEMREIIIDEIDTEKFGTLDTGEKMMAIILGDI